ncbi:hypothetical protein EBQ90_02200 [bacterium]|nr:hypothetical protein [bacterium]
MAIPYLLIALYLVLYWFSYLQGSQLYFGEAVSYEGLLRMLQGAPFATLPTAVPVSLTPYTPLFLLPLQALVKNIPVKSFWSVVTAARVFQTALLFLLFLSIQKINKRFFRNDEPAKFYWWAVLMVFAYNPVMEMALRPDTCSFIFEVSGVYWILHFLESRKNLSLVAGAFLFAAAAAVKLNTLGAVSGSILYLTIRKEWKAHSPGTSVHRIDAGDLLAFGEINRTCLFTKYFSFDSKSAVECAGSSGGVQESF